MATHIIGQYLGNYHHPVVLGFFLGVTASFFYHYILPMRHCPTNPLMSELIQLRKSQWKKQGLSGELGAFEQKDQYGLEQRVLNVDLLPQSMWMNVGFWKSNTKCLPEACQSLVEEIMRTAGIWDNHTNPFSILEVGCGCAETINFLRKAIPKPFRHYIGITLNRSQAAYAAGRLALVADTTTDTTTVHDFSSCQSHVYCADASNPSKWPKELQVNLRELSFFPMRGNHNNDTYVANSVWLLAVDTLYHFSPSRKSVLMYASHELCASLMATDIMIPDNLSWMDSIKLRVLFYCLQVPWRNILTQKEYMCMLVECGYKEKNITIRDITENSFAGFDKFTRQQMDRWEVMGGSTVISRPIRMMGWVMGWWARSGTARECIVIAKK